MKILILTHEDFYMNQPISLNMLHGHFCNAADHSDVVIVQMRDNTYLVLKDRVGGLPEMAMSQTAMLRLIAVRLELT